ncbi:MAG: hypothetical protein IJC07_00400 [Clostridia bacterium]|nr:hypothetical protein [Clostridia bacterium]
MTKKLKHNLIVGFFILFLLLGVVLAGVIVPRNTAKADEVEMEAGNEKISNGAFHFDDGAGIVLIDVDENNNCTFERLAYKLYLDDLKHANILDYMEDNYYVDRKGFHSAGSVYMYSFILNRMSDDGKTSTALKEYMIAYDYVGLSDFRVVLREWHATKDLVPSPTDLDVAFGFNYLLETDLTANETGLNAGPQRLREYFQNNGYKVIKNPVCYKTTSIKGVPYANDGLWGSIWVKTDSPYSKYNLTFTARYNTMQSVNWLNVPQYGEEYLGEIQSDTRSIAMILNDYEQNQGGIDKVLIEDCGLWEEEIQKAYDIIGSAKELVKVQYLVPIEGTPFATTKTENVMVSMLYDTVKVDDVCSSLGIDTLNCFDSACLSFEKDAVTETYRAVYLKNTLLRAINANGQSHDVFLDINLSMSDFYSQYIDRELITTDAYEFILNCLIVDYPVLQKYGPDDIYGLFGFVALPDDKSLDKFMIESFNVPKTKVGIIESYSFTGEVNKEQYEQLLDDYKYSNIQKLWNMAGLNFTINDTEEAEFFFFYSIPGTRHAVIGAGGQDDIDDGSFTQMAPEFGMGAFKEWFNNWTSKISNKNNERSFAEKLGIILIIAVVIYLIYLIFFKKGKRRR